MERWRQWGETALARQGRRLLCWFPFGMALGISAYFTCLHEPSGFWCAVVVVLGLCGALISIGASRYPLWGLTMRVGGAALLSVSVGFMLAMAQAHHQPYMPELPLYAVWTEGDVAQVSHFPAREGQGERVRLVLKQACFESPWYEGQPPLQRDLRVTLKRDGSVVPSTGDHVRFRVLFHTPSAPVWPYGRDMQREDWFSGLAGSGSALSEPVILSHSSHDRINRWREGMEARIMAVLPNQNGAMIAAVLVGETGAVSPQTRQDFAASGLAHLLAVAGLHLGLVIALCFASVRMLLLRSEHAALFWPCREIALGAALAVGVVYIVLTGCHIPGLRALAMAFYGALAFQLGRRILSLRALALVAIGLESAHPAIVWDVSFQMSMAAVMALIAGYDELREPLTKLRQRSWFWARCGVPIGMLALTSIFAGCATVPVSMAHFGAFQPWFVVANMVAVPLMAVWIMPWGVVVLLLLPFGWAGPALHLMGWGVEGVRFLAHVMAHMPGASMPVPSWPNWGLLLEMVGLSVLCLWRGKARFLGIFVLALGVASAWMVPRPVMLMAPDGQTLVIRTEHGWMMDPPTANPFLRTTWQHDVGIEAYPFPTTCQHSLCRVTVAGRVVLLDMRPRYEGAIAVGGGVLCADVALVVSRSDGQRLCPSVPVLDRDFVYDNGAWAVYRAAHGGLSVVSDRSARGERPWVPPIGSNGVPMIPLAREE